MRIALGYFVLASLLSLSISCVRIKDNEVDHYFRKQRLSFERLAATMRKNPTWISVSPEYLITPSSKIALHKPLDNVSEITDKQQLETILNDLRSLDLSVVKQSSKGTVFFTMQHTLIFEKGLAHSRSTPGLVLSSLDDYSIHGGRKEIPRLVFKSLEADWYVYLEVPVT